MSITYELRVHERDVLIDVPGAGLRDIGNHTGYSLIATYEDGSKTIQYVDLMKK